MVCVALVAVLLIRQRARGVLSLLAAIFAVQALGPVWTYLRGGAIYEGIVTEHIATATQGFALAIGGLLLADLVVRQRPSVGSLVDVRRPDRWAVPVGILLSVLTVYALVNVARMGPGVLSLEKLARIAAAGSLHYTFLTLAMLASATWPLIRPVKPLRPLFVAFLASYVCYCVFTQERDFVFALLALAFLSRLTQSGSQMSRMIAAGLVAVFAIGALSTGRSANTEEQQNALLQGSLLFVDTRVIEYVPSTTPYAQGSTYGSAVLNAVTRGRVGSEVSPTKWLVDTYSPLNTSGYGFSMSGEALMNFGMIGVLPVFLLAGIAVNLVVNRLDRSGLYAHLGYYMTMFVPYMFRSDSRGLMSGLFACLVLHAALAALAGRPRDEPEQAIGLPVAGGARRPAGGRRTRAQ